MTDPRPGRVYRVKDVLALSDSLNGPRSYEKYAVYLLLEKLPALADGKGRNRCARRKFTFEEAVVIAALLPFTALIGQKGQAALPEGVAQALGSGKQPHFRVQADAAA